MVFLIQEIKVGITIQEKIMRRGHQEKEQILAQEIMKEIILLRSLLGTVHHHLVIIELMTIRDQGL